MFSSPAKSRLGTTDTTSTRHSTIGKRWETRRNGTYGIRIEVGGFSLDPVVVWEEWGGGLLNHLYTHYERRIKEKALVLEAEA